MKKYASMLLVFFLGLNIAIFLWNARYKNLEHTRPVEASETDKNTEQGSIISKSGESTLRNPFLVGSQKKPWQDLPFPLIKSLAMQGDPEAQWQLSLMYDYCFLYNLKPQSVQAQFEELGKLQPACKTRSKKIIKELQARCSTVDDGRPIPTEAVTLWFEQSAKQGNLTAKLRQATFSQENKGPELVSYVEELRKNPRPEAVFEMGVLARQIEPYWSEPATKAAFSESMYAEYAWQLAACRAGLDCSASSLVTHTMVYLGGCPYDDYEQYVLNETMTPSGRKKLEENIKIIQENFLK